MVLCLISMEELVLTPRFSQTGGSVGIGFAISTNLATQVVGQLKDYGRTRRGWLVFLFKKLPRI